MSEETESATEATEGTEGTAAPSQMDLFAEHAKAADARMEKVLEELKESRRQPAESKKEETAERIYTFAETRKLVEDGKLTEDERMEYHMRVQALETEQRTKKTLAETQAAAKVKAQLSQYREAIPAILERGTEERKLAEKVFAELIEEGHPKTEATELAAYRIAFGREPKPKTEVRETTAQRQRSVESAGTSSGRRAERGATAASGLPSWLPSELAAEFTSELEKGRVYKQGMKDPAFLADLEVAKRRYGKGAA